jgi:hypothetical protein
MLTRDVLPGALKVIHKLVSPRFYLTIQLSHPKTPAYFTDP